MSDKVFTREQKVAKIQKLLDLAADGANEAQSEQAALKAAKLMQEWLIEEADLAAASGKASAPPKMGNEFVPFHGDRKSEWEWKLVSAISDVCYVHAFTNIKKGLWNFAGQESDVAVAVHMFVQIRMKLDRLARRRLSEHNEEMKAKFGLSIYNVHQCRKLSGCHPTVYRQRWLASWFDGASIVLATKLRAQLQTFVEQTSTALVLVEKRSEQASAWATDEFKLQKGKGFKARYRFTQALERGREDGQTVEVLKGIEAPEQPKLLEIAS